MPNMRDLQEQIEQLRLEMEMLRAEQAFGDDDDYMDDLFVDEPFEDESFVDEPFYNEDDELSRLMEEVTGELDIDPDQVTGVEITVMGDPDNLPDEVKNLIEELEELTR